jgi:hypothetical protein
VADLPKVRSLYGRAKRKYGLVDSVTNTFEQFFFTDPELTQSQRERLYNEFFREDVRKLSDLIGKDMEAIWAS